MAFIAKLLAGAVVLYVFLLLGAQALQRSLMYFPDPERVLPTVAGLAGVHEITLDTPDGETVIAWWAKANPGKPTLLYFHGNAGSLESRAERIRKYAARGYGVFIMSYRGYSGSTGHPSEQNNVADAKLAYDRLVALGAPPDQIVLYGESLGSGVAVQVAAKKPVAGIILDAPYTSMVDLAKLHHPHLPSDWFLTDRYETMRWIAKLSAPLLIVHGEADDIVPVNMGRKLYDAAEVPKKIAVFREAGHSDHNLFGSYEAIWDWLDTLKHQTGARAAE